MLICILVLRTLSLSVASLSWGGVCAEFVPERVWCFQRHTAGLLTGQRMLVLEMKGGCVI